MLKERTARIAKMASFGASIPVELADTKARVQLHFYSEQDLINFATADLKEFGVEPREYSEIAHYQTLAARVWAKRFGGWQ